MAAFIHCMLCYAEPSADLRFFFSSCGHVGCFNCGKKGCFTSACKICHKENPRVLEINRTLSAELAEMFTPMDASLDKVMCDMTTLIDFQCGHRSRLLKHLQAKNANFEKLKEYCQAEMKKKEAYKQEVAKLNEWKRKAEQAFAQMRAQRENEKKIQMQKAQQQDQRHNSTMNLTNLTHDPFRTPAPPGTNRSFVTSTPYQCRDQQMNLTMNSTMGTTQHSMADASLSFSAATGIANGSLMDSSGEVSRLVNQTNAVRLTDSQKQTTPRNSLSKPTSKNTSMNSQATRSANTSVVSQSTPAAKGAPSSVRTNSSGGKKRTQSGSSEITANKIPANMTDHFNAVFQPTASTSYATQKTPVKKTRLAQEFYARTDPLPMK